MAYAQKLPSYISPADYLLLEEHATTKHEYLDGVIYDWQGGGPKAIAGGSKDHNRVSVNVCLTLLSIALQVRVIERDQVRILGNGGAGGAYGRGGASTQHNIDLRLQCEGIGPGHVVHAYG